MSQGKCIATNCGESTARVFCGSCFSKLGVDLRRRLQIGATKTKRNPSDRRAARKYALVVMDAIEVLGEQSNGEENEKGVEEKIGAEDRTGTDG